ncbi:laccase domain-containing protein, partial [candidate division FCPU426 bacterium]|nr:laccase domain-containing protein [candidate division FCPU426 bacterium]
MRPGGFSRGVYRGLNLGLNTADDPHAVRRNRHLALLAGKFGPLAPV